MKSFSDILRGLRTEDGNKTKQDDLAIALGVSRSTVGMWESGKRVPTIDGMEKIADFFNVDLDYLYGKTDIRKKIHIDDTGREYYCLDDDILDIAQDIHENAELRALLEIGRKMSADSLKAYTQLLNSLHDVEKH